MPSLSARLFFLILLLPALMLPARAQAPLAPPTEAIAAYVVIDRPQRLLASLGELLQGAGLGLDEQRLRKALGESYGDPALHLAPAEGRLLLLWLRANGEGQRPEQLTVIGGVGDAGALRHTVAGAGLQAQELRGLGFIGSAAQLDRADTLIDELEAMMERHYPSACYLWIDGAAWRAGIERDWPPLTRLARRLTPEPAALPAQRLPLAAPLARLFLEDLRDLGLALDFQAAEPRLTFSLRPRPDSDLARFLNDTHPTEPLAYGRYLPQASNLRLALSLAAPAARRYGLALAQRLALEPGAPEERVDEWKVLAGQLEALETGRAALALRQPLRPDAGALEWSAVFEPKRPEAAIEQLRRFLEEILPARPEAAAAESDAELVREKVNYERFEIQHFYRPEVEALAGGKRPPQEAVAAAALLGELLVIGRPDNEFMGLVDRVLRLEMLPPAFQSQAAFVGGGQAYLDYRAPRRADRPWEEAPALRGFLRLREEGALLALELPQAAAPDLGTLILGLLTGPR